MEVKTVFKKHTECGKLVQTHTINNPKISDIDRMIYDQVINEK